MIDFIGEIKRNMASTLICILGIACDETNVSCPAGEYAAKTALPLIHNASANVLTSIITNNKHAFTLWCVEYVDSVNFNGGHILFDFSASFYRTIVIRMLNELMPVSLEWSVEQADNKALERAIYAKQRMRMLARKSGHDTGNNAAGVDTNECFTMRSVQKAIMLLASLTEPCVGKRALELRLNDASSVLLTMTHCVLPRERTKFAYDCAIVAEAALRVLTLAIERANNL